MWSASLPCSSLQTEDSSPLPRSATVTRKPTSPSTTSRLANFAIAFHSDLSASPRSICLHPSHSHNLPNQALQPLLHSWFNRARNRAQLESSWSQLAAVLRGNPSKLSVFRSLATLNSWPVWVAMAAQCSGTGIAKISNWGAQCWVKEALLELALTRETIIAYAQVVTSSSVCGEFNKTNSSLFLLCSISPLLRSSQTMLGSTKNVYWSSRTSERCL